MLNLLNKFRALLKKEEVFSNETNQLIRLIEEKFTEIKILYNNFENSTLENKKTLYPILKQKLHRTALLVHKLPDFEVGNRKIDSMYMDWLIELNTLQHDLAEDRIA